MIEKFNIDKSSWTPVKFGDVVKEPKESVKDPVNEGIEHVVGLEHIDPESIHLKRSEGIEASTTFTKKFAIDDVLFGRRRAYLKKAAQASFEGICSGDITVFRAKENLMPELLPFIVQNDKFFDFAIEHSAGGLSPRVKFKDLANYEFLLPPKEQQAELAELLWAMDDVIEKELKTYKALEDFYVSMREELLNRNIKGKKERLGNISKLQGGSTFKSKDSTDEGVRWLKIANVGFGEIKWDDISYLPESFIESHKDFILNEGDIVIALTRPILGDLLKVARIQLSDSPSLLNQRVGRIKITEDIEAAYLYEHLQSRSFLLAMKKELQGTDPPNISNKMYENYEIIIPEKFERNRIIEKLSSIENNLDIAIKSTICSKSLQKSLINQVF